MGRIGVLVQNTLRAKKTAKSVSLRGLEGTCVEICNIVVDLYTVGCVYGYSYPNKC